MVAALNRFVSRSSDKCRSFFNALNGCRRNFSWTEECSVAFEDLKAYLQSLPLLATPVGTKDLYMFLAGSSSSISSVLVRQDGLERQPVYYTSRTLTDAETRYLPLEKLVPCLGHSLQKAGPVLPEPCDHCIHRAPNPIFASKS